PSEILDERRLVALPPGEGDRIGGQRCSDGSGDRDDGGGVEPAAQVRPHRTGRPQARSNRFSQKGTELSLELLVRPIVDRIPRLDAEPSRDPEAFGRGPEEVAGR